MPNFDRPIQGAANFTLKELIVSETASRKGLDNTPDSKTVAALEYLAQKCLQPARDHFKRPIVITSGYRSPAVNAAVGGSATSFHSFGCAADVRIPGVPLWDLFAWFYGHVPFTELIAEELPGGWIHIALQKGRENERATKYKLINKSVQRASFAEIKKIMGP